MASKQRRCAWRGAIWLGIALTAGAVPSTPGAAIEGESGKWRMAPSEDDSVVAQRPVDGGVVSVICFRDYCQTILVLAPLCIEGSDFPVLVNSLVEAYTTRARCLLALDDGSDTGVSGVVLLPEKNLLLPAILLGDEIAVAVPQARGGFAVVSIDMADLRFLLLPLLPNLFMPESPWSDQIPHPTSEPPDDILT